MIQSLIVLFVTAPALIAGAFSGRAEREGVFGMAHQASGRGAAGGAGPAGRMSILAG